ncbi:hypothetical protein C8J57DRAFT_1629239 [Mycena rebaudengoi]|nr:hypothetical protein C8J57DRAFT_1629239 [Mycena rebaudengoi]
MGDNICFSGDKRAPGELGAVDFIRRLELLFRASSVASDADKIVRRKLRPAQIRWRSATAALSVRSGTSGAELWTICRRADNSVPRTALRTTLRTCAQPPCAPALRSFPHWRSASRKRSLHAPPCVVALNPLGTCAQLPWAPALNPCAPALRNFPDRSSASFADLPTTPPLMRLRPLSPEHMRPTHPAAIPDAPPARPASCVTGPPRTSPRPLTARQLPHAAAPFHTPTP